MNITNRILAIVLSSFLLLLIFELIRRRRLKERYAMLWLFTGVTILIFAIFQKALLYITALLGIIVPINAMFFLGIFFIIAVNLHFTLVISELSEQNKRLGQSIAFLETDIKRISAGNALNSQDKK